MPAPTRLPKLLLAAALTFAIQSILHAATDIEGGPDGTGQDASASVTSSDPTNTVIANGSSGDTDGNGGNGTASAILTPISDSNSAITATGGVSGPNDISILPTIGGNADASASVNASGNVTLSLSATGGAGNTPDGVNRLNLYGTGGNAAASASVITSGNISINVTSQGGAGGEFNTKPALESVGGIASIGTISAASNSGNIALTANDLGGDGNIVGLFNQYGIGADASITDAFSASTTGNISLTQNATAGVGRIMGNANSSLTFSCTTAASITANVYTNPNLNPTSNDMLHPSNGTAIAFADITGNANVLANTIAIAANTAAPASATSIVHTGPYPGFSLSMPNFAEAQATASSNVTANTLAEVYTSNVYFPKLHIAANSDIPQITMAAGIFVPNVFVLNYDSIGLPLTATAGTAQANPDRSALVNEAIRCVEPSFGSFPNQSQNFFDAEIDGILDPSLLPPEDLILKLAPQTFFFHSVELSVQINENTVLDKFFTNANFGNISQPTFFDLGPLQSFGNSPFDFTIDCHVQLLNNNSNEKMFSIISLYDMNPALLTPEPASLSLLTAATLPLLLKRRRPTQ